MAKAKAKLERRTKGGGVNEVVKYSKNAFAKIGILSGQGEHPNGEDGQTIAEVAFWNEYGTVRIPPRPFLRKTFEDNMATYKKLLAKGLSLILTLEETPKSVMSKIALKVSKDVQQTITEVSTPPNSELTIEMKKSSNPLIDTGTLRRSISWELTND